MNTLVLFSHVFFHSKTEIYTHLSQNKRKNMSKRPQCVQKRTEMNYQACLHWLETEAQGTETLMVISLNKYLFILNDERIFHPRQSRNSL